MTVRDGRVHLVGAGPGARGLLTVRGREVLERADVVVHDRLVGSDVLSLADPAAEIVDVGKSSGNVMMSQQRINSLLVDRARRGNVVVRLKGGDPFIFGRGYEELQACQRKGIRVEVVPGITSALAVPAALGLPLTLRGSARGFAVITARDASGVVGLGALRKYAHAETLVVLMGVDALPELARTLVDLGRDPRTQVVVIERGWMPGQRSVSGNLSAIAKIASEASIEPPAVIVVGAPAALHERDEVGDGSLVGKRVAVTRPLDAAHELEARLRARSATVVSAPLIEIVPVSPAPGWATCLGELDWIVFTSRHGARGFGRALRRARLDGRAIAGTRLAAVGPVTARELRAQGFQADLIPKIHRAEALVAELSRSGPAGARVLFVRGSLARDSVPKGLRDVGMHVIELEIYRTNLIEPCARLRAEFADGLDAVFFASPSAVEAYSAARIRGRVERFICIGPTTEAAAQAAGLEPVFVARDHSDAGLIAALLDSELAEPGAGA